MASLRFLSPIDLLVCRPILGQPSGILINPANFVASNPPINTPSLQRFTFL
jgi:hypothetical protein